MPDPILDEVKRRLETAKADVERLAAFIMTYEEIASVAKPPGPQPAPEPKPTVVPPSNGRSLGLTERVAAEVIRASGRPVPSPEMLLRVTERGVEVGGKAPASTLAARLSRAPSLEFERGAGWRIRSNALQEGESAPDAVSASGAQQDQSAPHAD